MAEKVKKEIEVVKNIENTTPKEAQSKEDVLSLEEENKHLRDQLTTMNDKMDFLMKNMANNVVPKNNRYDDVVIVHLYENDPSLRTHIELSNLKIDMVAFGEERTLTVQQFEELVGKHRNKFDKGLLAVGAGYEQYAIRNKLKTVKDYPMGNDFIKKLETINLLELEELYNKLGQGHKDFIISYFKRKIIEKDSNFTDIHKVELLNRLSAGCLKYEIAELTGIK